MTDLTNDTNALFREEHKLDGMVEALEQFMMDAEPELVRFLNKSLHAELGRMDDTFTPEPFLARFLETVQQTVEENNRELG